MIKRIVVLGTGSVLFALLAAVGRGDAKGAENTSGDRLDRREIVARHQIESDSADLLLPLGNGEFCCNVDGTGLETFAGSVLAHWGWFSSPLPEGFSMADVPPTGTFQNGRCVGPDLFPADKGALRQWMFDNPHRMNLARFRLTRADSEAVVPADLLDLKRSLNLWTGLHTSRFTLTHQENNAPNDGHHDGGQNDVAPNGGDFPVQVETCVGDADEAAFRITSDLIAAGALGVTIDFPYPTETSSAWIGDFNAPDRHRTVVTAARSDSVTFKREFGANASVPSDYEVTIRWNPDRPVQVLSVGPNAFRITGDSKTAEFSVAFRTLTGSNSDRQESAPEDHFAFDRIRLESERRWEGFWLSGGAVDLSGSADPRWRELERRIVLSQYQMKISASGSWPPPETGLLGIDPWRGQFHMEMVWWHLAHWFLWDRAELARKPLLCYERFREPARELAAQLGYRGYKWQKSVGPEGRSAPWEGNQVLLWKEPHPIFFAELDYRTSPTRETLEKWSDLIDGTAEHMADYPVRDENGVFHLDPVMPPDELGITADATFDLAYWRFGLDGANRWRERMGRPRVEEWDQVRQRLAPLSIRSDQLFLHSPQWTDTYENRNYEHPDIIGVFGLLPPIDGVDRRVAARTVEKVIDSWEWNRCWGWDFPMAAMAAVRTGRSDLAIEILLNDSPRNAYDERGVNLGGPCPYLPGNGGLLYAIAMMCAGWSDESDLGVSADAPPSSAAAQDAVRFPNGWRVRFEGLRPAL